MRARQACIAVVLMVAASFAQDKTPLVPAGKTQKVTTNIYVIPDQRVNLVPNIGIIVGREGVLVIDTGMGPQNAATVLAEVKKITSEPVTYLTITHFHPEHGMGAQSFPANTIIIYPIAQRDELRSKGVEYIQKFKGFSPAIADLLKDVKLRSASVTFDDEADINLGDFPVQLFYWGPAHTRGDEFVFLPNQRILFGGDVVVNRFFPIMPDRDASGTNWIQMLERMEKLNPAVVVPGHGEVGDASLIRAMHDYLTFVRDRVEHIKQEGGTLAAAEQTLQREIRAKYKDWDNPDWIKNAIDNFYGSAK